MTDKEKSPKKEKEMRQPQKATPAPKGKKHKRFTDTEGKYYWKYV